MTEIIPNKLEMASISWHKKGPEFDARTLEEQWVAYAVGYSNALHDLETKAVMFVDGQWLEYDSDHHPIR